MYYEGSRYSFTKTYISSRNRETYEARQRVKFSSEEGIMYTVIEGDTIDGIAYKVYGNAQLWWAILDANPQYLTELDINAGDIILIPAYSEVVKYCG